MTSVLDEGFVEAYSTKTGLKQVVPQHYIGHPVLGRNLKLTPSAEAQLPADQLEQLEQAQAQLPAESWTHDELDSYAVDHDIDLTAAGVARGTKAEKVALLLDPPTPDGPPVGDTTTDPA